MAEREVVLDEPVMDESVEALQKATDRADRAEAELRRLKAGDAKVGPEPTTAAEPEAAGDGEQELRRDSMMAHLLDSLAAGKDIGHYGRLVFAMVARHFMTHDEVLAWMRKDADFSDGQARVMLKQVEGKGYNPPRRERILEWQGQQGFPILPDVDDSDCGNLYRNLRFPGGVYAHIEEYQEAKL